MLPIIAPPGIIFKSSPQHPEGQMTGFQKAYLIRKGISKNELERLKEKARLDYDSTRH